MGWMTRFEPATSGSTDRRSNQLSYIHHKSSIVIILIFGRFCQKNFPPRFCKPGRTDKQPLIKSAAAGHKKPNRRANLAQHAKPAGRAFRKATPIRWEPGFHKGEHPTQTRKHGPGQALHRARNSKRSRTPHRARVPQGRAMQTRPRRALPNYLAGAAVCGAGKWRRLWRTWFCASTRSSAGHKHICKNRNILCWLPPKKVSCR